MNMFFRRIPSALGVMLVFALTASPATADIIIDPDSGLALDRNPLVFFQQTTSSPCVIGGNNCQNPATFAFTDAPSGGSGTIQDFLSPIYSVGQITAVSGGPSYTFGLDYNEAGGDKDGPQRLFIFEANYYIGAALLSSQIFDVDSASGTFLPTNNNGVGYSDFLLSNFVIPATATNVQFRARWYNNDGPDRYFIVAANADPCTENCTQVPEPASMSMMLFGVAAGVASLARRRKK